MRAFVSGTLLAAAMLAALPAGAARVYWAKTEAQGQVRVYLTDSQQLADCILYETEDASQASGADHIWFWDSNRATADVAVVYVQTPSEDAVKIYFTKRLEDAECSVNWTERAR